MEIHLNARSREDGDMFVTSEDVPFFSAVCPDGDWDSVLTLLRRSLEVNGLGTLEDHTVTLPIQ